MVLRSNRLSLVFGNKVKQSKTFFFQSQMLSKNYFLHVVIITYHEWLFVPLVNLSHFILSYLKLNVTGLIIFYWRFFEGCHPTGMDLLFIIFHYTQVIIKTKNKTNKNALSRLNCRPLERQAVMETTIPCRSPFLQVKYDTALKSRSQFCNFWYPDLKG